MAFDPAEEETTISSGSKSSGNETLSLARLRAETESIRRSFVPVMTMNDDALVEFVSYDEADALDHASEVFIEAKKRNEAEWRVDMILLSLSALVVLVVVGLIAFVAAWLGLTLWMVVPSAITLFFVGFFWLIIRDWMPISGRCQPDESSLEEILLEERWDKKGEFGDSRKRIAWLGIGSSGVVFLDSNDCPEYVGYDKFESVFSNSMDNLVGFRLKSEDKYEYRGDDSIIVLKSPRSDGNWSGEGHLEDALANSIAEKIVRFRAGNQQVEAVEAVS